MYDVYSYIVSRMRMFGELVHFVYFQLIPVPAVDQRY